MERIVVCVCTCRRPYMLASCLARLADGNEVPDATVELVVVDNEAEPNNQTAVERFAASAPVPVHYVHEPDPGVPQARNAALEKALALDADWIAFLDDDERPAGNWLAKLYAMAKISGSDVVTGPVRPVYPEDAGLWRRRSQYGDAGKRDGQALRTAATNNVIFRVQPVRKTGLRFDEALRYAGGEDTMFFRKLYESGARITWTTQAIVYETVPWERVTVRGHMARAFRKGAVSCMKCNGALGLGMKAVRHGVFGLVKIAVTPLAAALGPETGLKMMLSGLRNLSEAAGVFAGLCGKQSEYYRNTTGH